MKGCTINKKNVMLSAILLLPMAQSKAQLNYSFFSEAEKSDNLRQDNPVVGGESQEGEIVSAGVEFSFDTGENTLLSSSVSGRFARNKYSEGDLSDDDEKALDASILFDPDGSNFSLLVLESLQQVAVDRESNVTINNVNEVNTLRVTPSYFVNISPLSRIEADYSYTDVSDKEDDNSRTVDAYTVGFVRDVNTLLDWSINFQQEEVDYSDFNFSYTREEIFFGLNYSTALTNMSLEVGRQNIVEVQGMDDDVENSSVRLSIGREINSTSSISLSYLDGYSDATNINVNNQVVGIEANGNSVFVNGIAKEETGRVDYLYQFDIFQFSLGFFETITEADEDVIANTAVLDEELSGFEMGMSYSFMQSANNRSGMAVDIDYIHEQREFNQLMQENETDLISLTFSYQYSPVFSFYIGGSSRNSDGSSLNNNFNEDRIFLGVEYAPTRRR